MPTDEVVSAIDAYCARLRKALHRAPSPEREEIVEEVRSHILDRVEAAGGVVTAAALAAILGAVGDPDDLASEYRAHAMLRHAADSRSPWVILRATLGWARTGLLGTGAFVATVIGYGCSIVFLLSALLKPALPGRVGLWLAPQQTLAFGLWNGRLEGTEVYGISIRPPFSFVLGTLSPTDGPVRELLGAWLVPVALLCAVLCFAVTTRFARWLIVKYAGRRNPASEPRAVGLAGAP